MMPLPWKPTTAYANWFLFSFFQKKRSSGWSNLTYPLSPSPGAIPTGRFANKPMRKLHKADMAAVEVMRSWRTSFTQARYVWSEPQRSVLVLGHTQVPPVSDRMEALTEIYNVGVWGGVRRIILWINKNERCMPWRPEKEVLFYFF